MTSEKGDKVICKQDIIRTGKKFKPYAKKGDTLTVFSLTYYPVLLVENKRTLSVFSMREETFIEMKKNSP